MVYRRGGYAKKPKNATTKEVQKVGFRSNLEVSIARDLKALGVPFEYEKKRVKYYQERTYNPDFQLDNGIIIEAKGWFKSDDRTKHLAVRKANPELDIRFVFSNANAKLSKNSTTTYADWCNKKGFKYATKSIPISWIKEEGQPD